jgi:S1-C subfamily serine protease
MESSQYSYEAPGGSYEGRNQGSGDRPTGGSGPPSPPQSVPSFSSPADAPPSGGPVPPPPPAGPPAASPPGTAPVAAPVYPVPSAYPPYGGYPSYPSYPGYSGGYGPPAVPPVYPYPYAYPPLPTPRVVRHTLTPRTWLWVVVLAAVVAALIGGLVGAVVGAGSQQTIVKSFFPNGSALVHPQDVQAVLSRVEPAVVAIDSESGGSAGSGDFVEAAGTGMVLTPDGEVLTNNHVVSGATSVTVTLFGQTKALPAHVVGTDPSVDVALVQIDHASNLPTVTLGDSSQTRVGDSVLAIGNALALAGGPSVTEGIVSAENRTLSAQNDSGQTENLTGLLQTDAAINPGNSGGPLVDSQAQVVGMNTAVASSSSGNAPTQNIGFAITVDSVKPLLDQLRKGGTGGAGSSPSSTVPVNTAYIGVTVGPITPALQQQDHLTPSTGALVLSVQSGSPAEKAALQIDDVIVSLNGTAITSPDDLHAAIHPLKPGDQVALGIYRGSTKMIVNVTLGTLPAGG